MKTLYFTLNIILLVVTTLIFSWSISEKVNQNHANRNSISNFEEIGEIKADIISRENGELTTENVLQNRDLSLYLRGRHFSSEEDLSEKEKKISGFIWKCRNENKRGYVRATYDSLEGRVSTSHIFVEPNQKGKWRVIWRIVGSADLLNNKPEQ